LDIVKDSSSAKSSALFNAEDFESMFENSAIGMAIIGNDATWIHVNSALSELFGYSKEEIKKYTFHDLTIEEDRHIGLSNMKALKSGEESSMTFEKRYRHKSGGIIFTIVSTTAVRNDNGELNYLISQIQDISEQKKAEIQAKLILDATSDGYWDWNIKENVEYMSAQFWEMLGLQRENGIYLPKEWMSLVYDEDLILLIENFKSHVESKGSVPYRQEARFRHQDGSTVWVERKGKIVEWGEDGSPTRMVGTNTDITDLKLAERALAQSSKMVALGEMASAIAHEINNPLAIIMGHANQMQMLAESGRLSDEALKRICGKIEATSIRISKIINGLRLYSRDTENEELKTVLISQVLEDTLAFCMEKFRANGVRVIVRVVPPDLEIRCRTVQISQVLLNLLNNAYDSIKGLDEKWIQILVEPVGESVEVQVSDSGEGVPDYLQAKIMQPFFTTKTSGQGTGLGLSICLGIVESHQGQFYFKGNDPHPTFCFRLPK
tara:strand:- start:1749 stop:3230 length:1482 start_codon:yes stop_codon:yes gene_type:complete